MIKKILPVLLAVCLLASCTRGVLPTDPGADPAETSASPIVLPVPDEATVRNHFEKALEVYGWFELCSLDVDYARPYTRGTQTYHAVVSDKVPDYTALRTMVFDLFDRGTGESLLREDSEYPTYIEVDGVLYGLDRARGSDITKGEYTLSVQTENNSSVLCTVEVELIEFDDTSDDYCKVVGSETYTYHLNLVGNRWVFTDFYLFY